MANVKHSALATAILITGTICFGHWPKRVALLSSALLANSHFADRDAVGLRRGFPASAVAHAGTSAETHDFGISWIEGKVPAPPVGPPLRKAPARVSLCFARVCVCVSAQVGVCVAGLS